MLEALLDAKQHSDETKALHLRRNLILFCRANSSSITITRSPSRFTRRQQNPRQRTVAKISTVRYGDRKIPQIGLPIPVFDQSLDKLPFRHASTWRNTGHVDTDQT